MHDKLDESRIRHGFTLIELLVVMMIMALLATVAVLLLPRLNQQQRAGRGADQLQGWFLIAKQRALRSGLPSGLRLVSDPSNPNFITEVLYIEQPPDFSVNYPDPTPGSRAQVPRPIQVVGTTVTLVGTAPSGAYDFAGGDTSGNRSTWPVQRRDPVNNLPGDYLEIQGGGLLQEIVDLTNTTLTLAAPGPPNATTANPITTQYYRIIRRPRVLLGEEPLKLPANVGILMPNPNGAPGSVVGPNSVFSDFLFAPSGRLISPNVDPIYLWLADTQADEPTRQNEPIILSIKAATGFISNYPVDTQWINPGWSQPSNPYYFAQTGRSSGL